MTAAPAHRYEKARMTRFACRLRRLCVAMLGDTSCAKQQMRGSRGQGRGFANGIARGIAFVFAAGICGTAAAQATVGLSSTGQGDSTTLGEMQDLCRAGAVPDYDNVQSLERVFGEVARGVGGQIIRAELKQRGFNNLCVWVYEVKTLSDAGKVTMAIFDASDMRLIGFSTPSSLDLGPVVRVPSNEGIRKSLQEPDGDGRADSDDGVEAASSADDSGFSDSDATTADAAADSADSGQRGGTAGAKGGSAASDSSNGSAASGASDAGSSTDSGSDAGASGNASASTDGSAGASATGQ